MASNLILNLIRQMGQTSRSETLAKSHAQKAKLLPHVYGLRVNTCTHTSFLAIIWIHSIAFNPVCSSVATQASCLKGMIFNKYVLVTRYSLYERQVLKNFPVSSHHSYYTEMKCHGIAASSYHSWFIQALT